MDWLVDLLRELFADSELWRPIGIASAIFGATFAILRKLFNNKYPRYMMLAVAGLAVGLTVLEFNLLVTKLWTLNLVAGLLMGISAVIGILKYFIMQRNLQRVKHLAEPGSIDSNPVAAWRLLQTLPPKEMAPRQGRQYRRYRLFLLIHLGKISAVDGIIDELKGDQAFYFLTQHMKFLSMGKMVEAANAIKRAEEACTADTDPLLIVQILSNRGLCYVALKNLQLADDYFYRAIEYYRRHRMRSKELLNVLYYNYAFNKVRLGDEHWMSILEEYRSYLNLKSGADCVAYFDLYLDILREAKADRKTIDGVVRQSFRQVMGSRLPAHNKCFFAASVTRIVWSARIDPEDCLKTLTNNLDTLTQLPMPARYVAFQNIDLLFRDLGGNVVKRYDKLREKASHYMTYEAASDLEAYRKSLPEEAVLEKCFCYKELAALQKRQPQEYNFKAVSSYLENAINLYHENGLFVDEHVCRMAIMDELCDIANLDEDYRVTMPGEMRQQLSQIETFLPSLKEHSALAEFRLRLSFYCWVLDDYDKCVSYYTEFVNTPVALEHFAPWLHRYHMFTSFAVRIIYFKRAIEAVRESKELITYPPAIQEWFRSFPKHDGFLDSMLLGKFLGCEKIPLKRKMWIDPNFDNGNSPRHHIWLWLPAIHLEVDLAYPQFTEDKYVHCLFFNEGRHPFETDTSYKLGADALKTGLRSQGVMFRLHSESDLDPAEEKFFNSLYSIITSTVDENCPPLEKLAELYRETMLPVEAVS